MHYLAVRLLYQLARCITKGFNFPRRRTASLLLRGDSHLEIVINICLFQMDLLLDPQATDMSSNYVRAAVPSHRASGPMHSYFLQLGRLIDGHSPISGIPRSALPFRPPMRIL